MNDEEAFKMLTDENRGLISDKNIFSSYTFISSWSNHYISWIKNNKFRRLIIKYEDLTTKTYEVFYQVIKFIENVNGSNKKFNKLKAKNSINSTTFEKMRKLEKNFGFKESILSKNFPVKIPFFHLGPKNDWKIIFDKNYQNKINSIFKTNLEELDYIN